MIATAEREPWQLTKADFARSSKAVQRADAKIAAIRGTFGSRWGDARRFVGRSAGLRLERLEAANRQWSRAWESAEGKHAKAVRAAIKQGLAVPPEVLADYA